MKNIKKLLTLILSISLFASSFNELNSMKRFLPSFCCSKAPDAKRTKTDSQSEKIKDSIKQAFSIVGESLQTKLQQGFYESIENTKYQLTQQNQIAEQLFAIIDQIIKENLIRITFNQIDSFTKELATNQTITQDKVKFIIANYLLSKIAELRNKAEAKLSGADEKNIAKILFDFATTKTSENLEKQRELDVSKEITEFLQSNSEQIQLTTSIIGFSFIILGELAPNLTKIFQDISNVVSTEINQMVTEIGDIFANQISELSQNKTGIQDEIINKIIDDTKNVIGLAIEQEIGAKIIEILEPHINGIILNKISTVLPRGTHSAVTSVLTKIVKSKLTTAIANIKNKIQEKIEENRILLSQELTPIISQIVAYS